MAVPGMHLLNLTLIPPSSITQAIVGSFSPLTRQQQILVCRGGTKLELLQIDKETGKASSVVSSEAFGIVRSLAPFRLTGGTKDYIIVGSDSGRVTVLEYDPENNAFVKLQQETFGKTGVRRTVPGQYLAVDPKGRAIMLGAMDKAKLVYVLNRDSAANLTISSPLEAHKPNAIIHHIVGLDVGYENPMFAALEIDYAEVDQDPTGEAFDTTEKMLTYYELDLGLNHVVRRWSEPTDPRANLLVALPGGQSTTSDQFDGPSGVLVCAENYIIYKHQGVSEHRVPIPRRQTPLSDPNRGIIIVAAVLHKMKSDFFVLLQSEEGDLFKVTVEIEGEDVLALKIKYFDTIPVATNLCIHKQGFLFAASNLGNHQIYQFEKLGDDGDEVSSTDYPQNGATTQDLPLAFFDAKALDNLVPVDELDSLAPITDSRVANPLQQDTPQIFAACGRGARSSIRMIRPGLETDELVSSPLGFAPTGIWVTKTQEADEFDSYIVLSAPANTFVLKIGDAIDQYTESGILSEVRTLGIHQLGDDSFVQVHPTGMLRIRADGRREPWPEANQRESIAACAMNKRQIVLATSAGDLIYFEVDNDGELNEYMERKELGVSVATLSMADVPENRQRTPYLAIGCEDQTVRIVSLDPDTCMETISIQALTAMPSSICVSEIVDAAIDRMRPTMFVNIGLQNGVLLRTVLDSNSGQLTDTRTRFLGARSVTLRKAVTHGNPSVLALSSKTWLNYLWQSQLNFDPLIFDSLDLACGLSAGDVCPEGIIGISGETLRIFTLPKLGSKVKMDSTPLTYTPRKISFHPSQQYLYVAESDHRTLSAPATSEKLNGLENAEQYMVPPEQFGLPRAEAGNWGSCIRAVNAMIPAEDATTAQVHLDNNEAAFSMAVVQFASRENELHLVVGTAKDTTVMPRTCSSGYIRVYQITNDGAGLELMHVTEVDEVPTCLMAFQGRLMAGIGRALRIYDIGKRKLLRKAENKSFPVAIVSLNTQGSRVLVGDSQESIFWAVYKAQENRLLVFADDGQPRWTTCSTMLDYDTVALGDKFGNVIINRIPQSVSELVDSDPTGASILHEKPFLMGSARKSNMIAHFQVGDVVSSLHKVSLVPGGRETLLYTGYSGMVGMLVPFISSEDVDFFQTLEMHMRSEMKASITGREHFSYRSAYVPVKSVVDGNLCEEFKLLPLAKQSAIAAELDRTVMEVGKKLDQVRASAGF